MEKTTIVLRGDVKQAIEEKFGKRELSRIINELLFEKFIAEESKKMFGADKWLTKKKISEVREHHDRF
ncbi:MAG TPA: hypothetical protein VJA86_00825 [Candidatus Nanoarchaeia archaeon]|nr:hypothetical protein [Candidatus Nanoarchaeia archaeon]